VIFPAEKIADMTHLKFRRPCFGCGHDSIVVADWKKHDVPAFSVAALTSDL
jgi:hypothetical protein